MKSLFFFFLFLSSPVAFGQDGLEILSSNQTTELKEAYFMPQRDRFSARRNTLYAELGGSGGFGSFNFEWNFKTINHFRWMFRTGISGTYIDKNNGAALIFPVMLHGIYGENHCLDVGIGQSLSITTRGGFFLRAPVSIGYRLEPKDKRIFYRISYSPIVSYLVDFQWEHWAGVSIGFKLHPRFKR